MTELTEPHESSAAQPSTQWPETDSAGVTDPPVAGVLTLLGVLPRLPIGEHEAAYNELHDELLAALNANPAGEEDAPARPDGGV